MKKILFSLTAHKLLGTSSILLFGNLILAQGGSSSYNLNYVPIYGNVSCAFGSGALNANPNSGYYNTAFGANSLQYNNLGSYNTATGTSSLTNNISGNYNTAN